VRPDAGGVIDNILAHNIVLDRRRSLFGPSAEANKQKVPRGKL
jgi:hypothetical protein